MTVDVLCLRDGRAGFLRTSYAWARRQAIGRASARGAAGPAGAEFVTDHDEQPAAEAKDAKV